LRFLDPRTWFSGNVEGTWELRGHFALNQVRLFYSID